MKGTTTTLDMAYHYDKGGIFTKSDVGSYLYNNTLKPYALSEMSPTSAIIPNTVDSLTYTSFESVSTIMEDPYSASFVYNADNQRAKMEVKQNSSTILTRWYPSGSYIKETTSGTTKEYTFIGGDPYTAPVVGITQSGTTTYYYLLRDHLGSITHVVDASSGTLSYQYSYDAWGRMRTSTGWVNYNPGSEPALFIAGRGFTGHEHLPWFNLINMLSEGLGNEVISNGAKSRDPGFPGEAGNGRVYDPLTGQFLSPDNNIQDPYNSQNLNRYSYCLNNPLKYFDPSGQVAAVTIPSENWVAFLYTANLGATADQLIKDYGERDYYNTFEMVYGGARGGGGVRGMLSDLFGSMFNDVYLEDHSKKQLSKTYVEKLGNDGSFITFIASDIRNSDKVRNPGDIQMRVWVHSKSNTYSDYNFIQSAYDVIDGWSHDARDNWEGFYNSPYSIKYFRNEFFLKGANAYFEDSPNRFGATDFQFTVCGLRANSWEQIQTYKWGYSITNENLGYYFEPSFPIGYHIENIIRVLIFENGRIKH